jgi:hypothetical protein
MQVLDWKLSAINVLEKDEKLDTTLNLMLEDMATAPALYRPTHYWDVLLPRVLERIQKDGIVNLKHHPHFVPIYCSNAWRNHSLLY